MHDFAYRSDKLYCEDLCVEDLAHRFGTPLYVYSRKTLLDHYSKIKEAFAALRPLICFSVKSNGNLSLLKVLARRGAGLDIVSGGELYRALKVGVDPKKIVYAGVGKTRAEIEEAVRAGILFFNVESLQELGLISEVAAAMKKDARVCVRVNPGVDAATHRYIATGVEESKFGVDLATARIIFLNRDNFPRVKVLGLHVHIGSQIIQADPFCAALRRVLRFAEELKTMGLGPAWLNIGGGLGIIYKDEKPQTAREFAGRVVPLLKNTGLRVILEPGRFIVGNAGILVTQVLYVKETPQRRFTVVDAGMNDLIRPALYGAYHEVLPLHKGTADPRQAVKKTDVVGPICESGDFLARGRSLPFFEQGAYLAVMGAGAYGFSMASNYNARPRPAEVLVKGSRVYLVRHRETHADLVRGERAVAP